MKKIALTLASVMAAAAFAPEASAVPSFARQTGMACQACHFNSYPVLTGFGKAFKVAGYTMMGAQGKIEGDHLSLPETLNASVYMQARINQDNQQTTGAKAKIEIPDEFALFLAGRVSENSGVLVEYNMKSGGFANLKFPQVMDMGDLKLSIVPFSTDGLGPAFGFDLFATGATANGRVIENGDQGYSAAMYLGTNAAAAGAALVAASETFHVAVTPFAKAQTHSDGVTATGLGGRYVRAAYTPTIAGWEVGVGVQSFSGDAGEGATSGTTLLTGTSKAEATIIDFQAQGELAGMETGIYGSYGTAPAGTTAIPNDYNSGTETKSAFGLLAEVAVIPHTLMVDVGMMMAKTGQLANGSNATENTITLGLKYKIAQNMKLATFLTQSSGTAFDVSPTVAGTDRGKGRLSTVFSFGF